MIQLPSHFLWGAATSSHQVEGNNTNNDWWIWEQKGKTKDLSGESSNHFELFDQDFKLAQDLHHNAHRFSIEWSRIETQEGQFDSNAIDHYREVIHSLKKKSIEPVVTLHHFTNPSWFYEGNGFLNEKSPRLFARYVKRVVQALGKDVKYWITINEPMVLVYYGYLEGAWPPGVRSLRLCLQAMGNLIKAHRLAYQTIHDIYVEENWLVPQVGIAKNLMVNKLCPKESSVWCQFHVFMRHHLYNLHFLQRIKGDMDFIGVNYYAREFISSDKTLPYGLWGGKCNVEHGHSNHYNTLGWDSYPEGLYEALLWLKKFNKPILITENGTCEKDDRDRKEFIEEHIKNMFKAMNEGLPVFGYLYWSLIDNFEWHHGYLPRFGLIEVDYHTKKRKIRDSAYALSEIFEDPNKLKRCNDS